MSLFGSMTTAISGLTAQSRALGHVADNVANSQTVGFKRTDTNFVSYLTDSTSSLHRPGSVVARPDYTNTVMGPIQQVENPLAIAIAGQGFFSVARPTGTVNGNATFDDRQLYTRAGDFSLNTAGYLVNGAGYYLEGWQVDAAGSPDRTQITPVRVSDLVYNPVATQNIEISANLPAGSSDPHTLPLNIYDTLGNLHPVNMNWTQTAANTWQLSINSPSAGGALGTIDLSFGAAATPAAAPGTIGELSNQTGTLIGSPNGTGNPATVQFVADFGQGPQTVSVNLVSFGMASGITQYDGAEYDLRNLRQDGAPMGAYSGLAIRDNGDVAVSYDNGESRVIARVPITNFNAPDQLQRLDGQAFTRTLESGEPRTNDPGGNGSGGLVVGSVEGSNVDIASEFTKLIVSQRAYSANTRIVSAADEMLQDTINMRR